MTHIKLEDCKELLKVLAESEDDPGEIGDLAERIGVSANVKDGTGMSAKRRWQAVLRAALSADDGYGRFIDEVLDTLPEGRRTAIEEAAGGVSQRQTRRITGGQGQLETACQKLASSRTLNEMKVAAANLRAEVLAILDDGALNGDDRNLLVGMVAPGDAGNISERLGILGMNVLTVVDRLLELTDNSITTDSSVSGSELFLPKDIDDLMPEGMVGGTPVAEQTTHLARNARSATWLHAKRFISALRDVTTI